MTPGGTFEPVKLLDYFERYFKDNFIQNLHKIFINCYMTSRGTFKLVKLL